MSWIKTISYKDATGKLKRLYDRMKGPNNALDHVMTIHSLRPHSMEGHMAMYKAVLHHSSNQLPKWYLELLGTYVSLLNGCNYCFEHHAVGVKRNLNNDNLFDKLKIAVQENNFSEVLDKKFRKGIAYANKLTTDSGNMSKEDIENLRAEDFNDGEILEINQVVSYFNYVNRTVTGLGVLLEDGNIGLSPSGDDWSHQ